METPLISLCMIVKNEEAILPRCLASVQAVVDEMIIVDTGSTDHTREIALAAGAQLYEFEWIDDFSAARNYSLAQASGRWILVMDADEELERDSGQRMRKLAQADEADAYLVIQRNFYRNRLQHTLDIPLLRFFRNHPNYRYRKRYHEDNKAAIIESNGRIAHPKDGLIIFHDGYLHPSAQGKPRVERAIQTMRLALSEEPDNAWLMAKLGLELYSLGRKDEAYDLLYRLVAADSSALNFQQMNLLDTHEALAVLGDLAFQRGEYTLTKFCGLAGRKLTDVFELRIYSELAVIGGTLGEIIQTVNDLRQANAALPKALTSESISLLRQKQNELTELAEEIQTLLEGFTTLLTSSQRNLLRSWKNTCRQLTQTLGQIISDQVE
jgi:glycosyltransferase involved in cell wall biosynthesis